MAPLHDRRARLLDALYRQFGEGASWQPAVGGAATVLTVRRKGPEMVDLAFGDGGGALADQVFLRVRVYELPAPALDDVVTVQTGDAQTEDFKVIADPRRVKAGMEWQCEVVAI